MVGLSAARHIRHGDVQTVSRRASCFSSTANTVYNNDGSVTIDFRHAITDEVRNGIKAYVASTGRFDSRWLEHVTMQDMSWLRDRRGIPYKLHGAGFSRGSRTLGDVLSWFSIQPGVTRFSPCTDMSAQSIAKRRHFGSFCLALAYNFPSIMYRALPHGAMVSYSARVHQHHEWLLDEKGASLSYFDTGIRGGTTIVDSMLGCDRAASRDSKTQYILRLIRRFHGWCISGPVLDGGNHRERS